ncbi:MAG: 3-phosphoshikimate 1-carboxyvinyltransferase [Pirellulales bacterium]
MNAPRWPDALEIQPLDGPVQARVRPPGSKSLTNRALVTAALAQGRSLLVGALESDDTRAMRDGLSRLGIELVHHAEEQKVEVTGCTGRLPAVHARLDLANSGTSMRFLTALVALGQGTYRLDGNPRMRQRPIGDLLAALAAMGVEARAERGNDCPPVVVRSRGLAGGLATVRGDTSSQFLSGLLMAAPYARQPVTIELDGALVSQPYVAMTLAVMSQFGVTPENDAFRRFRVPAPACYRGRQYEIEPDASAASYFFAAAAVTGGTVTVEGLGRDSLQGDVALVDILEQMGCTVESVLPETSAARGRTITVTGGPLRGVTADMNAISDTAQTLAVVALFASGPTTIRNVAHIRHKETDRIAALCRELEKLGARLEEHADGLTIHPGRELLGASIETYDDHRMAMSFAVAGLRVPGMVIRNPGCVAKTYPRFFGDLSRLYPPRT